MKVWVVLRVRSLTSEVVAAFASLVEAEYDRLAGSLEVKW